MGVPDVVTDPPDVCHELDGPASVMFEAILLLVHGLGQVGVQHHALVPRQLCRLPHQIQRHAEGRARRHDDLCHGADRGVVVPVDHGDHVVDDRLLVLDDRIGGQPARRLAEAHRAPRPVKPEADARGGLELVAERRPVREEVLVVSRGRASAQRQLREGDLGRHPDIVGPDPRPDRIQDPEPVEQPCVLRRRDRPREGLIEVMVCVDQTGDDDVVAQIEHPVGGLWQLLGRPDLANDAVDGEQPAVGDLAPLPVHRGQDGRVPDEEARHRSEIVRGEHVQVLVLRLGSDDLAQAGRPRLGLRPVAVGLGVFPRVELGMDDESTGLVPEREEAPAEVSGSRRGIVGVPLVHQGPQAVGVVAPDDDVLGELHVVPFSR